MTLYSPRQRCIICFGRWSRQVVEGMHYLDAVIATVATQRRRFALYYLREEGIVQLEELARRVAGWEAKEPQRSVPSKKYERVLIDLQHNHLEKFREAACIEYDELSRVIRYRDPPEPLPKILDVLVAIEHPTHGQ